MSIKSPDKVDIAVGQRIRILRLDKGLSQTTLAEKLGVTFQQVQKYEKGVNRVSGGRLATLAQLLGTDPNHLLAGVSVKQGVADQTLIERMLVSKPGSRIAKVFVRMSPKHQSALADMIEAMGEVQ